MARNQTNTSEARELTDAELDRVSGGNAKPTTQTAQEIHLTDVLVSSY
jgi:hypothetical protein